MVQVNGQPGIAAVSGVASRLRVEHADAGDDLALALGGGLGNDAVLLGAGADTFTWDPGEGSDTVEGQAGADTLRFNGANVDEDVDISRNGGRVRFSAIPGT